MEKSSVEFIKVGTYWGAGGVIYRLREIDFAHRWPYRMEEIHPTYGRVADTVESWYLTPDVKQICYLEVKKRLGI